MSGNDQLVATLDPFETWFASHTRAWQQEHFRNSYAMRIGWNAALASGKGDVRVTSAMVGALLGVDVEKGDYRHLVAMWKPRIEAMLAALSSQEGKVRTICSSYHARAVGVACSNCGLSKEEHPVTYTSFEEWWDEHGMFILRSRPDLDPKDAEAVIMKMAGEAWKASTHG